MDTTNEPVAWMDEINTFVLDTDYKQFPKSLQNGMIPLYTHPVKEQSNLVNVVKDHIKDLQECVLILNDSMLVNTANEMKVAIKELKDAIDTHPVKELTDEEIEGIARANVDGHSSMEQLKWFARAILRKAQEK